ncbi:enoyl-CoA hydratase/isomerase family protein [Albidovulum sp.]|uniref:enoyl-CoA hydratase/isomerase family protein n=1 Tax=Albidovulum sp. TaxID=1872424 RepID=UPI003527E7E2
MIRIQSDGELLNLCLSRTDKANALTREMLRDLVTAVEEARRSGVRALVLSGEGKVFSAGADLDEARAGLASDPVWEHLSSAIAALPCLTIAALNGTLAGGAFGMVLACDLRLAVPEAKFFYPVMRLGFLPQPSDPRRLAALIGPSRAKMILMAGLKIGADEALGWGLIDRIVAPGALAAEAAALADAARAADLGHVEAIKRLIAPEPAAHGSL